MQPVIASYVSDFLKPDMLHVYRQITGLQAVVPWVLTHKRENAARFPFPARHLSVLPKPRLRWWRRFVHKHIKNSPWEIYPWELRKALLEITRADARLLHVYFGHTAVHLRPLIKACPHPVVVSFHGADAGVDMDRESYLRAMREVFAASTLIQCRSESLAEDLRRLGCDARKLHVQRTGIPLEEWPMMQRTSPQNEEWRLLQSCRLIPKKGLDVTLRAFKEITKTKFHAKLIIAGDGPLMGELVRLAESLGISKQVSFPGFLDQVALREEVYKAHFFLHPSRTTADGNREGIPNSMLEAMASGAPVIATRHGGIPEAITSGDSGLLVEENDYKALALAVNSLMAQPERVKRMAEEARGVIEKLFDRNVNLRRLERCYLDLIAQGGSS